MLARKLRKEGTLGEVLLWQKIKGKLLGVEFHRQVPVDNFIIDFYCHELMLAIEIDGSSHRFEDVGIRDVQRQLRLEGFGIRFLRLQETEVCRQLDMVVKKVAAWVDYWQDDNR